MGQEILYCSKCLNRLVSQDFEKGRALRLGNRVTCLACAPEVLASLPPDEQKAFLKEAARKEVSPNLKETKVDSALPAETGSGSRLHLSPSRAFPAIEKGSRPHTRGFWLGAGLVAAVILVTVFMTWSGKGAKDVRIPPPELPRSTSPYSLPSSSGFEAARAALEEADRSPKEDLEARIAAYRRAVTVCERTPQEAEAKGKLEALLVLQKRETALEWTKLEEEAGSRLARQEFRAAAQIYETARDRHKWPEWSLEADRRLAGIREALRDYYQQLSKEAENADGKGLESLRSQALRGGYPELFKAPTAAGGQKPLPVPSPGSEAYLSGWRAALGKASAREFESGMSDLKRLADSEKDERLAKEAREDAQLLEKVSSYRSRAMKQLCEPKPGHAVIEIWQDRHKVMLAGLLSPAGGDFDLAYGDRHRFVYEGSLAATSIAATQKTKSKILPPDEIRLITILCLLEGDPEGAKTLSGDTIGAIPPRFWSYAEQVKPPSVVPTEESEAFGIFEAAEEAFLEPRTIGLGLEKVERLEKEFALTRLVKGESVLLRRRALSGRDYVFSAEILRSSGSFFLAPRPPRAEWAWTSDDVPPDQMGSNFVEAEFFAAPGTAYRAWVYVGACCQETMSFGLQTTDLSATGPRREQIPAEPGDKGLLPVKPSFLGLRATHAAHGGPKEPKRWEWVALQLPKFPASGPKKLRIISDQRGFSVAYLVVSAVRTQAPGESDLKQDLEKLRAVQKGRMRLVALWKCDEGAGTVLGDASGSGHGGSLQAGVAWDKGISGSALCFGGGAGLVEVVDAADLRLSGDMTISLWVRKTAETQTAVRLIGRGGDAAENYGLWLAPAKNGSRMLFRQSDGAGMPVTEVKGQTGFEIGVWHHVACLVRGSEAILYTDGRIDAKGTRNGAPDLSPAPLTLGARAGAAAYSGLLEEVRIFASALGESDLEYLAGMAGVPRAQAANPIAFLADKATIHGGNLVRYGEGENSTLQGWSSTDCSAEWALDLPRAGRYKIELVYSCENNNGGSFVMSVGDQKVSSSVPPTASWQTYSTLQVGTLFIPKGKTILLMKAPDVRGGLMNLKVLRLLPAP